MTIPLSDALEIAVEALEKIASDPKADQRSRKEAREALGRALPPDLRLSSPARVSALDPPRL